MQQDTRNSISILVCAYKNAEVTRLCLETLKRAFNGLLPETILVDDTPGDEETAAVARDFPEIIFTQTPVNKGFAGANNHGLAFCTKPFIALVNNDLVFDEEPFSEILVFMKDHPRCAMAQGTLRIRNWKGNDPEWLLDGCGGMMSPFGTTTSPGWLKPSSSPVARKARRCFAPSGALLVIRREAIESTGRLFYDFFHSYYEETDFSHRAQLLGWESWYVPTKPVEHRHSSTFNRYIPKPLVLRRFYKNIRFSFATCFGMRGRLLVRPLFETACFLQCMAQLLHGRTTALRAHIWALRELSKMRGEIKTIRAKIQSSRKISDKELLGSAIKHYESSEIIGTIKSNI